MIWMLRPKSIVASKPPAKRAGLFRRVIRGGFDSAMTNDGNRRHWAHADGMSADAAASPEVRRVLRNRARYETANNAYAKGIVLTLANDVVGTGPRVQMLSDDDVANERIEQAFMAWAKSVGLPEKLRTMRASRATDGEVFAVLVNNPSLAGPVKLDLRLIEADQVTTPDLSIIDEGAVDGIVFDAFGNPVEYHILKGHPGDARSGYLGIEYDRVPAASVIHYFRTDRPGQSRGIPDITPALPLFAQLRRYTLAVIAAAETAADFAGILYTDAPANGEAEPVEPMDAIKLEPRSLLTMPGGWRMAQMQAEQPSTGYAEFKREILSEIARCLNMPVSVASGDSSRHNFASGRLDHQVYFKNIRVEQDHLACVVLDRILAAWLREAVLVSDLLPLRQRTLIARGETLPHQWFWDGTEHVDPAKEANAQATRLASNTTTLATEYARQGRDWETELRQRAKEVALMQELGLNDEQARPLAPTGNRHEEDDDAE